VAFVVFDLKMRSHKKRSHTKQKESIEVLKKNIAKLRKAGEDERHIEPLEEYLEKVIRSEQAAELTQKANSQTTGQKVCMVLFFLGLAGLAFAMSSHSFVPSSIVNKISFYASGLLTIVSIAAFFKASNKTGGIGNNPAFKDSSLRTKIFLYPLLPVIIYGFFWINLGIALPQLANEVIGSPSVNIDKAEKRSRGSSRRNRCRLRLGFSSADFIFFRYCLSRSSYDSLPDSPVEVVVYTKQSYLGTYVQSAEVDGNPLPKRKLDLW